MDPNKIPRVFISYSWSSPEHVNWIISFAKRLTSDGIFVIFDRWDLKVGQDVYQFMESIVNDPSIHKVLVICDRVYAEKANNRVGGVGTESQIISKVVYSKANQEKFIPLVREFDPNTKEPFLPNFFQSRLYLDISNDKVFEETYEKILRNLYGKPELIRPRIGMPPSYIESPESLENNQKEEKLSSKIRSLFLLGKSQKVDKYRLEEYDYFVDNNSYLKEIRNGLFHEYFEGTSIVDPDTNKGIIRQKVYKKYNIVNLHGKFNSIQQKHFFQDDPSKCEEPFKIDRFLVNNIDLTGEIKLKKKLEDNYQYTIGFDYELSNCKNHVVEIAYEYIISIDDKVLSWKLKVPCKLVRQRVHLVGKEAANWRIIMNAFSVPDNTEKANLIHHTPNLSEMIFNNWSLPGSGYNLILDKR